MIHSLTGLLHTAAACLAMVTGLVIFGFPKGSLLHKRFGYIYTLSMIVLLITAFMIYRLTGSFNFLHVFACVATLPLVAGLAAVIGRFPAHRWVAAHYCWMCWSYIGLISAFVAEMSTRVVMPYLVAQGLRSMAPFWVTVGVVTFLVTLIGALLVRRNLKILANFDSRQTAPAR